MPYYLYIHNIYLYRISWYKAKPNQYRLAIRAYSNMCPVDDHWLLESASMLSEFLFDGRFQTVIFRKESSFCCCPGSPLVPASFGWKYTLSHLLSSELWRNAGTPYAPKKVDLHHDLLVEDFHSWSSEAVFIASSDQYFPLFLLYNIVMFTISFPGLVLLSRPSLKALSADLLIVLAMISSVIETGIPMMLNLISVQVNGVRPS